ncbi:MAG: bifunctional glutamate N-acetyltransferase/amino-acid acetyltransferase ArgJ [Actinomycetota bacterium]|nr:bifunctional glutamate N-acetyltransferase/amino-acid acetyltransferase ArgJ [Actinomycetota bacterium]MEC8648803.1 bifunctional glutamate N-acetyltransferase/amino-acid acetyltransferase ArgJ [Actinomycetota bacterium]MEC9128596.1 bifunctional glutamate N-acetyltransferase/amino-acid acetyltransferase ArgJ [Actinomycetota bacterium]MEC9179556.1 bifunctional glutamate N-acetyltransferase/amino-acid acetyltransferase ArgJ [Actinomycetota bacterium]MED5346105.1 bifunctional glutamate N-acetylt|tara:strand:+ start:63 stop:1262 length:1200 start_codon:yes stop_codon:yes gene_type:complete
MSVTAAQGFRAQGIAAGIKPSGRRDLAIIINDGPSDAAAAVFTSNRFPAAPVLWSRQVITDGSARAVIVNSGGANACTGPEGFADSHTMAERTAAALQAGGRDIGAGEVLVCSTGLIGELLPMDVVNAGIDTVVVGVGEPGAAADPPSISMAGQSAAEAIMTTDTVPKTAVREGDGYVVGGMAKGAGMLAPGLATMLVFITTDADVSAAALDAALRHATSVSFDRIDSDGCMSTNDAVIVMASGSAQTAPDIDEFTTVLTDLCVDLAQQLIADAEGASKDIAITVHEAASDSDALEAARTIARSNLLKCAIHGEDPNWGRVLSALGTTTAAFESDRVDVAINGVTVCRGGGVGDPREGVDMRQRDVVIDVHLKAGPSRVTVWTNDLTADYVHENSAYST